MPNRGDNKLVLGLSQKSSYYGSPDSETASIWSSSTIEGPRVTRLYQSLLLVAGFMATFQTMGTIQTYGIFQVRHLAQPLQRFSYEFQIFQQEYYTSEKSNIVDGPGQYSMTSLIGTIGGGLTWSGSIFVSVLLSSGCHLNLMCLAGAALMSLGFILASFATKVDPNDITCVYPSTDILFH
jgi:hypothetical protein